MDGLASALGLGLLLGLRHATDADHVVAVTAIVARERSLARAARIGVLWGVGHSLTVFVLGGAIIVFRLAIPPRVGLGLEFLVAVMLILLGFANLRPAASHAHDPDPGPGRPGGPLRPVVVGIVHGLAGSAAVAILVLTTIHETGWALAYLALFGAGTVVGMLAVTVLLAAPALAATRRVDRLHRGVRLAAGALSVAFGVLLARELIVEGGLLSATPSWSPR